MIFAMFAVCMFGIIPRVWERCLKSENLLSMLNCFSSGLFLGMALVHMMPETVEIYEGWAEHEGIERPFPLPYVGFFLGYVLILAVDRVIAKSYHLPEGHTHAAAKDEPKSYSSVAPAAKDSSIQMAATPGGPQAEIAEDAASDPNTDRQLKQAEQKKPEDNASGSKATAIMLVMAIGVHALFEGMALGLQKEMDEAVQLAVGILLHKSAAAVSLGGAFTRAGYTLKQVILFIVLFALTTPLGIIIGMLINHSSAIVDTIFMALSGGTFVYVACSEIIVAEFDKGKY